MVKIERQQISVDEEEGKKKKESVVQDIAEPLLEGLLEGFFKIIMFFFKLIWRIITFPFKLIKYISDLFD